MNHEFNNVELLSGDAQCDLAMLTDDIRFWERVIKTDSCWIWSGAKSHGYGEFYCLNKSYTPVLAHRYSWLIHFGHIPDGLFVCHKCDVRDCVNPDHLFVGTNADNIKDAAKVSITCAEYYQELDNESPTKVFDFYADFAIHYIQDFSLNNWKENVVFEGSQGILLDEKYGFQPHTTWSDVTFHNAEKLLNSMCHKIIKVGVIRTYMTRHGAGPFVSEAKLNYPEMDNIDGMWQGEFRQGYLNIPAVKYAINCAEGIDELAVTHCDVQKTEKPYSYYEGHKTSSRPSFNLSSVITDDPMKCKPLISTTIEKDVCVVIESLLSRRVVYSSWGPTAQDVKERLFYE